MDEQTGVFSCDWPAKVLNMGLPYDGDSYVHRAGRTARAGRPGKVVTLMSELDVSRVEAIERRIGKQLELLPTKEEEAIKLLSKTTKALQRAELLLSEVGFADQIAEHRGAQKEQKKKKAQAPGSQAQADSKELTGSKGLKKKGLKKNPKALGKATAKHKA